MGCGIFSPQYVLSPVLSSQIGIVVDYTTHIVVAYFEATNQDVTRNERVRHVMTTVGGYVMLGGFSTFLGVLPLSLCSTEIFRIIFLTFLGIVGLGTTHGLVLTPVLLSLVGPLRPKRRPCPQSEDV